MKFAKELDENAVPEWRGQYLDYKQGKKKLKAVTRALRNIDKPEDREKQARRSPFASLRDAPVYSLLQRERQAQNGPPEPGSRDSSTPLVHARSRSDGPQTYKQQIMDGNATPRAKPINERSPLQANRQEGPRLTRYGSIMGTPPDKDSPAMAALRQAPSLELPDPAMSNSSDPGYDRPVSPGSAGQTMPDQLALPPPTQLAHTGDAYKIRKPTDGPPSALSSQRHNFLRQPKRVNSTPEGGMSKPFMRRMFSVAPSPRNLDVALEAYREADFRQAEFFLFLDKELIKIEKFYKQKEDDAIERLKVLREQLHIMRDRRLEEIVAAQHRQQRPASHEAARTVENWITHSDGQVNGDSQAQMPSSVAGEADRPANGDTKPGRSHPLKASVAATREALEKVRPGQIGKTSRAMEELGTPSRALSAIPGFGHDPSQDYTRRPHQSVPYRAAKRKLKVALAEFYRGLELLKSYALLNRTAFRKINKKYDKTVNAHPALRYMSEKVNTSHFVQSSTPDDLISQTEDLYARYFERGNHKVAVSKLRAKVARAGDYTAPMFRTGLLLAAGAVFAVQGVVAGGLRLEDRDTGPEMRTITAYLLQIYAGYFLMLLLAMLFVVDAAIFSKFHVNYQFIFEFEPRHMLDWKQLAEMPAYFWFLLGFTMWCNFSTFGTASGMYIYWPVILIGVSIILFCCPPPLFYPRSRGWFLQSNWRLLLAGVYPVEFRDFFLGDMFCSLTYAIGNVELFFCLYAHYWNNPPQCNSSQSHLLGFFSCLPGIWRLLQCFRRYYDTRLWTHLANGAKYTCTILQYLSLSLWRIYGGNHLLAFFIVSACLNGIYCSFWDLQYDWSMPLNLYSKPYPLLRPMLAYRKRVWWYYAAMFLDPVLRFNWIVYVIYRNDLQHSSLVSFLVSLSEVIRRGIWVVFRVENEHCANVGRTRAMRDPELPYEIRTSDADVSAPPVDGAADTLARIRTQGTIQSIAASAGAAGAVPPSTVASGRDVEAGLRTPAISMRQRRQGVSSDSPGAGTTESPVYRALQRVGTTFMTAHAQDYERKRKPGSTREDAPGASAEAEADEDGDDSDSDGE